MLGASVLNESAHQISAEREGQTIGLDVARSFVCAHRVAQLVADEEAFERLACGHADREEQQYELVDLGLGLQLQRGLLSKAD